MGHNSFTVSTGIGYSGGEKPAVHKCLRRPCVCAAVR